MGYSQSYQIVITELNQSNKRRRNFDIPFFFLPSLQVIQ